VNLFALNLAGLVTLWYLGYRPKSWVAIPQTRRELLKRGSILVVALLVSSAFLVNVTYSNVQQSQLKGTIENDIEDLLGADTYANVILINVKLIEEEPSLRQRVDKVIITVGRPPGETHPELQQKVDERVHADAGRDVQVELRIVLVFRE
jgi:uncharacterized membrane protein